MDQLHPRRRADLVLRAPRPEDAAALWGLVERDGALDANSPYAYLLLCSDFAATGAIVEADGDLAGFVLGYRPPPRPEAWFVWQIGVDAGHRGLGLATTLLEFVLGRLAGEGVTFLEATVTPSNAPSAALFQGLARRMGAECRRETAFGADLFPGGDHGAHEAEVRLRIGPFDPESLQKRRDP